MKQFLWCCVLLVSIPSVAFASPLVITEIGAFERTGQEWIEVQNVSLEPFNISAWKFVENNTRHGLTFFSGTSSTLAAGAFALIVQDADAFIQEHQEISAPIFDSAWGTLKESGEEIGLMSPEGVMVDIFTYPSASSTALERTGLPAEWRAHPTGHSAGEVNFWWGKELPVEKPIPTSTPAPANNVPEQATSTPPADEREEGLKEDVQEEAPEEAPLPVQPFPLPEKVVINEVMAYPFSEQEEWIELFVQTQTTSTIEAWEIFDAAGRVAVVSGTFAADSFVTVPLSRSVLNNSGDEITLFTNLGAAVDSMSFGQAVKGRAFARVVDGQDTDSAEDFALTAVPTKGGSNKIVAPVEQKPAPSSSAAKRKQSVPSKVSRVPAQQPARPGSILLSELVADPADGQEEFVELWNPGEKTVSLVGWWIAEGSGAKTGLNLSLSPGEFVVIHAPKGHLNNAGDVVQLVDATGRIIDMVAYGNWDNSVGPAPSDPEALARNAAREWVLTKQPTPGRENVIAAPAVQKPPEVEGTEFAEKKIQMEPFVDLQEDVPVHVPTRQPLLLSEVLPNPDGSDQAEFIELHNRSASVVDLSGLRIDDAEGGSKPYRIPLGTRMAPGSFLVFPRTETKIALNNTSDGVRLLRGDQIVEQITYSGAKEGFAYIQQGEHWEWSQQATPGAENILLQKDGSEGDEALRAVSLALLPDYEEGERVMIEGRVTTLPGMHGSQYFYLTDDEAAVQVYMYKKAFPALRIGQTLQVEGSLSFPSGEPRIKVRERQDMRVAAAAQQVAPFMLPLVERAEQHIGRLVQLQGEVVQKKGGALIFDDGTDSIRVVLKQGTGLSIKHIQVADVGTVTGILRLGKSGWYLMPRFAEDIVLSAPAQTQTATTAEESSASSSAPDPMQQRTDWFYLFLASMSGWVARPSVLALLSKIKT